MLKDKDYFLGVAISEYLSDWEESLSNEEIIKALRNNAYENVTVWEPFEHYDGYKVAELIEDFAVRLNNVMEV